MEKIIKAKVLILNSKVEGSDNRVNPREQKAESDKAKQNLMKCKIKKQRNDQCSKNVCSKKTEVIILEICQG